MTFSNLNSHEYPSVYSSSNNGSRRAHLSIYVDQKQVHNLHMVVKFILQFIPDNIQSWLSIQTSR